MTFLTAIATYTTWTNGGEVDPDPPGPPGVVMPNPELVEEDMRAPVLACNLPVAKVGDTITPHGPPDAICQDSEENRILTGSKTVLAHGRPVAGTFSQCACGHWLRSINSPAIVQTVFIDDVEI